MKNNIILDKLSSIKSFEDRVEFAEEHFDKLGSGSSRTIFQISDSIVLKVAHNDKGIAQNKSEISVRGACINNVLASDADAKWVLVRFTDTVTEEKFEEVVGMGIKPFMKALYWKFNNEVHEGKPKNYEKIMQHPLFKCLAKAIFENDLQIGDVAKASSFGMLEGKIVLRDFGLTKDVFARHYEDESGNETSTL